MARQQWPEERVGGHGLYAGVEEGRSGFASFREPGQAPAEVFENALASFRDNNGHAGTGRDVVGRLDFGAFQVDAKAAENRVAIVALREAAAHRAILQL